MQGVNSFETIVNEQSVLELYWLEAVIKFFSRRIPTASTTYVFSAYLYNSGNVFEVRANYPNNNKIIHPNIKYFRLFERYSWITPCPYISFSSIIVWSRHLKKKLFKFIIYSGPSINTTISEMKG